MNSYIPQSAFLDCCKSKKPSNSLFLDIADIQNITFDDLESFLSLVVALFEYEPLGHSVFTLNRGLFVFMVVDMLAACVIDAAGDFSVVDFQQVFSTLDENVEHRLSQSKTRKDRMRWASDDL